MFFDDELRKPSLEGYILFCRCQRGFQWILVGDSRLELQTGCAMLKYNIWTWQQLCGVSHYSTSLRTAAFTYEAARSTRHTRILVQSPYCTKVESGVTAGAGFIGSPKP